MTAAKTLHQKILSDIEGRIVSGEWPPGHRLPFEIDLAKSYDVSRMTMNKVLTQLAKSGLIERRKKSGSFVAQPQAQSAILEIYDIETEVRALDLPYSYEILSRRTRTAETAETREFHVSAGSTVEDIRCLHYADTEPFCVEERLISLDAVPEVEDASFAKVPPGEWLLQQVPWSAAEHRIFAINARGDMSELLGIPQNAACLVVQRRTWSDAGPVTYVRFTYPGDKHAMVAHFRPAST